VENAKGMVVRRLFAFLRGSSRIIQAGALILAFIAISNQAISAENSNNFKAFDTFSDCDACSEMVVLPAGEYMMGATKNEFEAHPEYGYAYMDETPRHKEVVNSFAIGKYDVTKRQFSEFSDESGFVGAGCDVLENGRWRFDSHASWRDPGFLQTENDPVVCIAWEDATAYIKWLNDKLHASGSSRSYRLPTETEWEYAARAGVNDATYWGGNRLSQCKFENARNASSVRVFGVDTPRVECDTGFSRTAPVGSFNSNPWGLFDMLGNVHQWVADCSRVGYRTPIPTAPALGALDCSLRALRGASWATVPFSVRAAARAASKPTTRSSAYGFRLATDMQSQK
jgi:formylglycine-generating enzyme required for sulfatase activity